MADLHDTAIATVEVDLVVPDVLVTVETSNLRGAQDCKGWELWLFKRMSAP